jgi:hypothetical protein
VRPKWFLSLWYVWRKPCTYLVSRFALSPNGLKRASTWDLSLGVLSGASEMIFDRIVHLAQTVLLSFPDANTVYKLSKQDSRWPTSPRSSKKVRPRQFLSLWYVWHKKVYESCTKITTISIRTLKPRHLGVLSGASKIITEPMVCLAQAMHLSCTDTNTISKWTETRFDMTHIT